ncbi:MAG: hypothetical protein J1E37_06105 [Prevotella sp.]|nr:hypothetical protein [Prevotella sp.]
MPEETNVSVTITGNTEDNSTKDSEGMFTQETVVSKSWQAQADSYDAEPDSLKNLVNTFKAAQPVQVGFDQTTGAANSKNRVPANASFKRSGQALMNDLTFTFNDRATVSVAMQFQGTGPLS